MTGTENVQHWLVYENGSCENDEGGGTLSPLIFFHRSPQPRAWNRSQNLLRCTCNAVVMGATMSMDVYSQTGNSLTCNFPILWLNLKRRILRFCKLPSSIAIFHLDCKKRLYFWPTRAVFEQKVSSECAPNRLDITTPIIREPNEKR